MSDGRLAGQVALVTGAGTGIGAAIAKRLAADGATVHVTGRRAENTQQTAAAIIAAGGTARWAVLDVSDGCAVAQVIAAAAAQEGRLDILVANAALAGLAAYLGPLTEVSDDQWRQIIDVNLSGVFFCAREAARVMIPRRSGCIVTIGSVNSFTPEADVPAYAAAKGGVLLLTKSLARDLGPYGIRVNGVAPGGTDTPRMEEAIATLGMTHEQLVGRIPLGRRGQSDEIAAVVAFLASDEASYISGQTIAVDGGFLCT
ncbi:MAG: glucose 1-dehydrogenase [Thermomicrobiales bacterium]